MTTPTPNGPPDSLVDRDGVIWTRNPAGQYSSPGMLDADLGTVATAFGPIISRWVTRTPKVDRLAVLGELAERARAAEIAGPLPTRDGSDRAYAVRAQFLQQVVDLGASGAAGTTWGAMAEAQIVAARSELDPAAMLGHVLDAGATIVNWAVDIRRRQAATSEDSETGCDWGAS